MSHSISRQKHKAFTLIEVLVVVAIIALLVAILLPSLAKARSQARTAVCQSNARQHAQAAQMFAVESKGLIPRGGNRTTVHWTQLVLKMLGNKLPTRQNVNLVPVESFEVFHCPERSNTYPGKYLDYIVNALDHRGPVNATCSPTPGGSWHEVRGVAKIEYWKRPAETIYIIDAAREDVNKEGTLRKARQDLQQARTYADWSSAPTSVYGLDSYDIYSGGQVALPEVHNTITNLPDRSPRAAYDMHGQRGAVASFGDAHVELVRPPSELIAPDRISTQRYYWRSFGVQNVDTITSDRSEPSYNCNLGFAQYSG